jgi:uncharacterized protein (DUF1697 family)
MSTVVLLRGVNVGGSKAFQPSALAKRLAELDVASIGAAGTFVVRGTVSPAQLRDAFRSALPFDAQLMICPGRDVQRLATANPFGDDAAPAVVTRYVSVLANKPRLKPALPIEQPPGDAWQVKVIVVIGRFVLSLHRRLDRALVYPNEVVEQRFAQPATTRNWNTIEKIAAALGRE